jgi:hypothetical protein
MTNALKAQIIVLINAIFALLLAFNVNISDTRQGAITVVVNAFLGLWVALTYQMSSKRTQV